jgi:hypothetical protein
VVEVAEVAEVAVAKVAEIAKTFILDYSEYLKYQFLNVTLNKLIIQNIFKLITFPFSKSNKG